MITFAHLFDQTLTVTTRPGSKLHHLNLKTLPPKTVQRLAILLNSEHFQKSVELDDRDMTPTIYFFRVKPFVIPPEFDTTRTVVLHDFTSSDVLLTVGGK